MIYLWKLLHEDKTGSLHEIVQEVLGMDDLEQASYEDLMAGQPKVRAFFYEINRLKGTAPILSFEAAKPVQVSGLYFPKGTLFQFDMGYLGTLDGSGIP